MIFMLPWVTIWGTQGDPCNIYVALEATSGEPWYVKRWGEPCAAPAPRSVKAGILVLIQRQSRVRSSYYSTPRKPCQHGAAIKYRVPLSYVPLPSVIDPVSAFYIQLSSQVFVIMTCGLGLCENIDHYM